MGSGFEDGRSRGHAGFVGDGDVEAVRAARKRPGPGVGVSAQGANGTAGVIGEDFDIPGPEAVEPRAQRLRYGLLGGKQPRGDLSPAGALNGLYAPNQGLFPAYAGGRYEQNGTVMIVSRGLARESTRVPRWYNRPELVIIDLEPPAAD